MRAKKLLVFVDVILIGLVLWLGADIVMKWIGRAQGSPAALSKMGRKEVEHRSDRAVVKGVRNYYYIITHDVFNTAKKTHIPATPKEVQVTQLPLRLKGTVVGTGHVYYAVIQEGTADKEKLYTINDVVQRARIVKIAPDYIILDVSGKKEALNISYERKPAPARFRRIRRPPRAPTRPARTPAPAPGDKTTPKSLSKPSQVSEPAVAR